MFLNNCRKIKKLILLILISLLKLILFIQSILSHFNYKIITNYFKNYRSNYCMIVWICYNKYLFNDIRIQLDFVSKEIYFWIKNSHGYI